MSEYHERLNFRDSEPSRKETAARGPLMTSYVQEAVSVLKPGMRIAPIELLPRLPSAFLEENYVSLQSVMASLMFNLRRMDKEGVLMALPDGNYVVQKQSVTNDVETHMHRTRLACLHMRDSFLRGDAYAVMLTGAPERLLSLYDGVDGLKRGIDNIATRITKMTDPEFRQFYRNLDDTTLTDSPLKGLG